MQIAGSSGAVKSTIAAELARRGLLAIDADHDPLLARMVDAAGAVVTGEPEQPDLGWLARHYWNWDPARLDALIRAAAPVTLYVCGLRAAGAIPIDARAPVDRVVSAVLAQLRDPAT